MKTMKGFFKVVRQSEPIKVSSQKVEGGQLDKSVVTLQELGGRNTFVCSLFGSSALCRWSPGDVVFASLYFCAHEHNGNVYQEIKVGELITMVS